MSYTVGQVLYVLNAETMRLVPIQVVEQVVRRTKEGEKISYRIVIPNGLDKPVPLEKVKGTLFESLEEAQTSMKRNALNVIDSIVRKARQAAISIFNDNESELVPSLPETNNTLTSTESEIVTLPDGKEVKVNIPTSIDEALSPVQN